MENGRSGRLGRIVQSPARKASRRDNGCAPIQLQNTEANLVLVTHVKNAHALTGNARVWSLV